MPLRTSSRAATPTKGTLMSFTPANDAATHRDLLMFEERLKANAAMLKRRRSRYQGFLVIIVFFLCISSIDVVFTTHVLIIPINFLLTHVKPPYGPFQPLEPHPYLAPGVCLTAGTTLFLFFAGGFWAEKIGYANKYVSHANKTLRSFNMYLNVRPRPMSSMWIMRVLRSSHRTEGIVSPPLTPITTATSRRRARDNFYSYSTPSTPSPAGTGKQDLGNLNLPDADSIVTRAPPTPPVSARPQRAGGGSGGGGAQITPIPPPTNPRGELIFNSRVDRTFRESYERYRTAYERAKEEWDRRAYEERARKAWWSWFLMRRIVVGRSHNNNVPTTSGGTGGGGGGGKGAEGTIPLSPLSATTAQPRHARTASRGSTPTSSRKPSPAGSMGSASGRKRHSALVEALESVPERLPLDGDSVLMRRTPTPRIPVDEESDTSSVLTLQDGPTQSSPPHPHKRKESFSFLLGRPGGLSDE